MNKATSSSLFENKWTEYLAHSCLKNINRIKFENLILGSITIIVSNFCFDD